eukprot:gene31222-35240_t
MRKRGYSPGFAAGIIAAGGTLGILLPPSITMILYAVAAEQSLGRLFLAGIGPGVLLGPLFASSAVYRARKESRIALDIYEKGGVKAASLHDEHFTLADKVEMLPRVLPFLVLLIGVMVALYGGFATPSETAGLGALLAMVLIAIVYRVWRPKDLAPILTSTIKESTMLLMIIGMSLFYSYVMLMIIGMSLFYSYVMSYLHISQSAASWVVGMQLSKWLLLTAPIILPPLKAAGFDLIWFGVVMTVVMEMGLIHPPVGLNIFVIKNIAPDIPLRDVIWGVAPFVVLIKMMNAPANNAATRTWDTLQRNRAQRLQRACTALGTDLDGKSLPAARI